jgi:hypothetical protein
MGKDQAERGNSKAGATFDARETNGEGDREAEGERDKVRGEGGAMASVIARERKLRELSREHWEDGEGQGADVALLGTRGRSHG